jgi:hypothetical protein
MRYVKRSVFQSVNPHTSSRTSRVHSSWLLLMVIATGSLVFAQNAARINGKYTGKIEASADAGAVFNLFMGDRDFDFRTEIQLAEDAAGIVTGVAQFIDQKNRRSVGNPTGQRSGSRLRFAIPLRDNCAPIQVKAVVSAEGDVLQFPASNQVVNCSGSGISVGVRIKLKAFTLAR